MTRPIFEPTTQRAIRSQGFGGDQLFRRPGPRSGVVPCAALMHEIDFENFGDENVAANTWEQVTDGSNGRFFTEAWRCDGDWGLDFDGDGNFTRNEDALYESWMSVYFGNANDGDTIGAAVEWQHSSNFFYDNSIVLVGGVVRVTAMSSFWGTLTTSVRYWVYASAVSAITRCEIYIRRFEIAADGEIVNFP